MSNPQFSKVLRRILFTLLICIGLMLIVFVYFSNPNVVFQNFQQSFTQTYDRQIAPLYDSIYHLPIIEPKILHAEKRFYEYYLMRILDFQRQQGRLNDGNKQEQIRLQQTIQAQLEKIKQLRSDPSLYNLGGALKQTLSQDSATLEARLLRIDQQLAEADWYYVVAKDNLWKPIPEKSNLALEKQLYTLRFLQSELRDSINASSLTETERKQLANKISQAQLAVKDYLAFCRSLQFEHQDSTFLQSN